MSQEARIELLALKSLRLQKGIAEALIVLLDPTSGAQRLKAREDLRGILDVVVKG